MASDTVKMDIVSRYVSSRTPLGSMPFLLTWDFQGYVEFDIDEEDNFGQQGKIVRKERASREKTTKHLSGKAARELYLECLQLILRKQIWWLVHTKKLPGELETVVRDLWDLRIRNLDGLTSAAADETEGESGHESGASSGTELFSSQAGSESDASTATTRTTASRGTSWTSEPGQNWNLPGLSHTLALCYLGCLTLRLPVRVGQVYNWAKDDRLLYLGAFDALPPEMTARLPGSYHTALKVKNTSFRGGELHQAILELVLDYHLNYEIVFPPLNTPLLLLHWLRELALPGKCTATCNASARKLTSSQQKFTSMSAQWRGFWAWSTHSTWAGNGSSCSITQTFCSSLALCSRQSSSTHSMA